MRTNLFKFEGIKKSAIAKVAGVVFLGALGSGLWESMLKPAIVRISYGLLSLSSLGIKSIRAGIYESIATRDVELASLHTLGILTVFIVAGFFWLAAEMLGRMREVRRQFTTLEQRASGQAIERPDIQSALMKFHKWYPRLRKLVGAVFILILLELGTLLVDVSRVSYETAAVRHFNQVLTIASPYLNDAERRDVESRFAQIQSRADYVQILDGLADTAKAHGQRIPKFRVW